MARFVLFLGYIVASVFAGLLVHFVHFTRRLEGERCQICLSTPTPLPLLHDRELRPLPTVYSAQKLRIDYKPNVSVASRSKFSSHRCTGPERSSTRSCLFRNLYFDLRAHAFQYYEDPDGPRRIIGYHKQGILYDFPKVKESAAKGDDPGGFLYLHSGGSRGRPPAMEGKPLLNPWTARKIRSRPPDESVTLRHQQLHVLWEAIYPNSFGHFLLDNMLPILKSLTNLQTFVEDFQLVLTSTCKAYFPGGNEASQGATSFCEELQLLISPGLSSRPVTYWDLVTEEASLAHAEFIRFDQIVVGGGGFSCMLGAQLLQPHPRFPDRGVRAMRGDGVYWWLLRTTVLENFGICSSCTPEAHHVVLLKKKGRRVGASSDRQIVNLDEVYNAIARTYPSLRVSMLDLTHTPWLEQLRLMSTCTILIASRGSVSYRLVFMPRGSATIVPGIPNPGVALSTKESTSSSHWDYDTFLSAVTYCRVIRYHVKSISELQGSFIPSKYREFDDANVVVDLDRFLPLFAEALEEMSI